MIDKIKNPSMGWIYWDKENGTSDFSDGELAYTSFNRALRSIKRHLSKDNSKRFHPTQKHIYLYKWLLTNYAKPGDKIIDTHLGSGSSRIACYDMGFNFVGYELDKDYFEAQDKRFNDFKMQQKLF